MTLLHSLILAQCEFELDTPDLDGVELDLDEGYHVIKPRDEYEG